MLLIISLLMINSCDDKAISHVTTEEAAVALAIEVASAFTIVFTYGFGGTLPGVSYNNTSEIYTLTAYDISDISDYNSLSGTINGLTGTFDLAFSGGPVVTLVFDGTNYLVNGYDMTSDLTQ